MSYDVNLLIDTGGDELFELDSFNYTYNVAPMLRLAFDYEDGIYLLDNTQASVAADYLRMAIYRMKTPDEYLPLNPPNGWGSYEGCLDWLQQILAACEKHPKAYLTVT